MSLDCCSNCLSTNADYTTSAVDYGNYINDSLTLNVSTYSTLKTYNKNLIKKYNFAGGFNKIGDDGAVESFYIKKVLYKNPVTVVFWSDGTKTVAKTHGGDSYNPESGLIICVLKKLHGSSNVRSLLSSWVSDEAYSSNSETVVTSKDARKAVKA